MIKIKKKPKDGNHRIKDPEDNSLPNYDEYSGEWDDATTLGVDSKNSKKPDSISNQEESGQETTLVSGRKKTKRPNDKFASEGSLPEDLDTTTSGSAGTGQRGRGKGPLNSESPRSFDTDQTFVPTTLPPDDVESGTKFPFAFFTTARSNEVDKSDTTLVDSGRSYSTVLVQTPRPLSTINDSLDDDDYEETEFAGIVTPIGKFDPINGSLSTTPYQSGLSGSGSGQTTERTGVEGQNDGKIFILEESLFIQHYQRLI